ncbi:hypothetical protein P4278_09020 [Bacillus thuringiensis]|uniref:hypothetical protein n=1 Tax=Bacillus TaxID=1386 RepID=UPI0029606C07|nr:MULTISPECIES: hypothetical protein [Bacillus]MED2749696.1 hypothetical protein [Bacillus thuringiensis]EKS7845606.1 hypothetical protein [Bacillus cereus]MEB2589486.1 hypothetical protein [Bacillus cereus]MEB2641495.1 hypothetical protein [Bacillus sp. DAG6]MED2754776.1 hypothetical protein [Bacillus thuringiensis]
MKNYILSFIKSPYLYISLLLIVIFPFLNILHNIRVASQTSFKIKTYDFYLGPYTMWVGIENGDGYTSFLYMLLPILVAIPCVFIYFDNKESGYHYFARYKLQNNKYKNLFFLASLFIGFLLPLVILLINFLSMFLIWPNFHIDYVALDNAGRGIPTFMFPSLFFDHPFFATIINIIVVSMYGSMFAVISITCSVYISKKFICLTIPFILQILVGFLSAIFDSNFSWTPAQFLDMSIKTLRLPAIWIFIIPIAIIMIAYIIYKIKDVNYE